MPRKLIKLKNYDVHSITSCLETEEKDIFGKSKWKKNANIAIWIMQSAMGGKMLTVALDNTDYTYELVKASGVLNVNFLAKDQTKLIAKLGRKSGRDSDKFKNLAYGLDNRNCPYLTEAIGYIQCEVVNTVNSGDHDLFVCNVVGQKILNPEKTPLTHHYLREKGLIRG